MFLRRSCLLALFALLPAVVTAQTAPAAVDTYLMPVSLSAISGAHGSTWTTMLSVANPGDRLQLDCDVCPLVPAQTLVLVQRRPGPSEPGLLFNVPREVSLALRTLARNATGEQLLMELPLPRLSDFTTGAVRLQMVPAGGKVRTSLRIFAQGRDETVVRIRISDGETMIVDTTATLRPLTLPLSPERERFYPASVRIDDLAAAFPAVASVAASVPFLTQIEITPVSPAGMPIWAMATATHNETQQFNNFTP